MGLSGESFGGFPGAYQDTYVQLDTSATAIVSGLCSEIAFYKVQANTTQQMDNPSPDTIDFFITSGDILIVTGTAANKSITVTIEWGEEI